MKYRLMDILACPMCKGFPLELIVFKVEEYPNRQIPSEPPLCELYCSYKELPVKELDSPPCMECIKKEITEGVLFCRQCNRWYPIIDGIPHMLPDYLREKEKEKELDFLSKHKSELPEKIVKKGLPYNLSVKE